MREPEKRSVHEQVLRSVQHDIDHQETDAHPTLDVLLDHMMGLCEGAQSQCIAAHLIACDECRKRLRVLQQQLDAHHHKLRNQATREQSLTEYIMESTHRWAAASDLHAHQPPAWRRIPVWIWGALQQRWSIPAWVPTATVVGALAVILLIQLPTGLPPVSDTDVKDIGTPSDQGPMEYALSDEGARALLESFDQVPVERAVLLTLAYLNTYDIPLEPLSSVTSSFSSHVTQGGDTWETVSQAVFKTEELWPLILMLNHDKECPEGGFPAGLYLRVPRLDDE